MNDKEISIEPIDDPQVDAAKILYRYFANSKGRTKQLILCTSTADNGVLIATYDPEGDTFGYHEINVVLRHKLSTEDFMKLIEQHKDQCGSDCRFVLNLEEFVNNECMEKIEEKKGC